MGAMEANEARTTPLAAAFNPPRAIGERIFTCDEDSPCDLCFIRGDGSLRPGHDRINKLMKGRL